jgi:hypothetical protein
MRTILIALLVCFSFATFSQEDSCKLELKPFKTIRVQKFHNKGAKEFNEVREWAVFHSNTEGDYIIGSRSFYESKDGEIITGWGESKWYYIGYGYGGAAPNAQKYATFCEAKIHALKMRNSYEDVENRIYGRTKEEYLEKQKQREYEEAKRKADAKKPHDYKKVE